MRDDQLDRGRREFLRGVLGVLMGLEAGCFGGRLRHEPPRGWRRGPIVDVHCHVFNFSDLAVPEFSEEILNPKRMTGIPREVIVELEQIQVNDDNNLLEAILGLCNSALAATPTGTAELELLLPLCRGEALQLPKAEPADAGAQSQPDVEDESEPRLEAPAAERTTEARGELMESARRIARVLLLATRHRFVIAGTLARTYPHVSLFMPALVDFDHWLGDTTKPRTSMVEQVCVQTRISRLAAQNLIPYSPHSCLQNREPALFHGYVAFCPKRQTGKGAPSSPAPLEPPAGPWVERVPVFPENPSALEIAQTAVRDGGFVGVKIYPPCGFRPSGNTTLAVLDADATPEEQEDWAALAPKIDECLTELYKWAEDEQVPILAHASVGNVFRGRVTDIASPQGWNEALSKHKGLRVCVAHFLHRIHPPQGPCTRVEGVEWQWSCFPTGASDGLDWAQAAIHLTVEHQGVFLDISNSEIQEDPDYAQAFFAKLFETLIDRDHPLRNRIMWGSDYWMNHLRPGHLDFPVRVEQHFRAYVEQQSPRPSEAWVRETINKIMGLNALHFIQLFDDKGRAMESKTRKRLEGFYEDRPGGLPRLLKAETIDDLYDEG